MPCYECRHIRANGHRCRALAMQDTAFCWFHQNARKRAKREWGEALTLPTLEDAESVQLALGEVLTRLADGRMETRSAGVLLYGLQIASTNLRNTQLHRSTSDLVTQTDTNLEEGELAPVQASNTYYLEGEEPEEDEDDDGEDEEDC